MPIDSTRLKQIIQPIDLVLKYDLENLRRENELKRASLWNQVETSNKLYVKEFLASQPVESKDKISSEFMLAKLLLSTAAKLNNDQPLIVKQFNEFELALITEFEKFNVFDILSAEQIADRLNQRKDLRELAFSFYENENIKLDAILESKDIRKDLKIAFNLRYRDRLSKVVQGVQTYIGKYGIPDNVGQKENSTGTRSEVIAERNGTGNINHRQLVESKTTEVEHQDNIPKKSHWTKVQRMQLILSIAVTALTLCGLLGWKLIPWEHSYTLVYNVVPADLGTILVNPLPDQDGKYINGTKVTLVAKPTSESHFVKWSGDIQATTTIVVVTMNDNESITAEFERK
jgi:hypothetical protein